MAASQKSIAALTSRQGNINEALVAMGPGYSPASSPIQLATMQAAHAQVLGINVTLQPLEDAIATARTQLDLDVNGLVENEGIDGLIKMMRNATGLMEGLGVANQSDAKRMRRLVNRASPVGKKKVAGQTPANTKSTIEKGIGSMIKYAEDFTDIISTNPNYNPTDPSITVATFTALVTSIKNGAKSIKTIGGLIAPPVAERRRIVMSKVNGFEKNIANVRRYVRGNFGRNSAEWNSIKNL